MKAQCSGLGDMMRVFCWGGGIEQDHGAKVVGSFHPVFGSFAAAFIVELWASKNEKQWKTLNTSKMLARIARFAVEKPSPHSKVSFLLIFVHASRVLDHTWNILKRQANIQFHSVQTRKANNLLSKCKRLSRCGMEMGLARGRVMMPRKGSENIPMVSMSEVQVVWDPNVVRTLTLWLMIQLVASKVRRPSTTKFCTAFKKRNPCVQGSYNPDPRPYFTRFLSWMKLFQAPNPTSISFQRRNSARICRSCAKSPRPSTRPLRWSLHWSLCWSLGRLYVGWWSPSNWLSNSSSGASIWASGKPEA